MNVPGNLSRVSHARDIRCLKALRTEAFRFPENERWLLITPEHPVALIPEREIYFEGIVLSHLELQPGL
jgi:hypothetical protein